MHVALVIWSLVAGGAQRALVEIAGHLVQRGHVVTLITMKDGSTDFFATPAGVRRVALADRAAGSQFHSRAVLGIRTFFALRSALRESRPDVVLSFVDITNVSVLLASVGLGTPVLIGERTYPPSHKIGLLWQAMRRISYPLCRRLVVQTSEVAEWARCYLPDRRIATIPNAVPRFALGRAGCTEPRRQVVLGVGRLVDAKGFDLLIRAFALSELGTKGWRLVILGEGPMRAALENLCRVLDVAGYVDLPGETTDPAEQMSTCAIFALSSRYEGFPNVLLEAMACGAAPVAFDCLSGPRDVIEHGVNGLLVPAGDVPALAAELSNLARDPARQKRLASNAERVAVSHSPDVILKKWTELLECHA